MPCARKDMGKEKVHFFRPFSRQFFPAVFCGRLAVRPFLGE
jgi:hypothetical protein